MLSVSNLRKVAARSGARDIGNVEVDVILTYLLQLFSDKGITAHLAFKGGHYAAQDGVRPARPAIALAT